MTPELETFLSQVRTTTDTALKNLLAPSTQLPQQRLVDAMQYSVLNGGKRIRPALCFAAALVQTDPFDNPAVIAAACATELIHAYSLIHDDLPAMDDDDLRRGKPTSHIAFDEATAILAGDALQALAFQTLSDAVFPSHQSQLDCIRTLATSSGVSGLCGGQMIDLQAVGQSLDLEQLQHMHRLKTGALIEASLVMGAQSGGLIASQDLHHLKAFAHNLGLAFQIKDDILDAEGDAQTLGKQPGADAERDKPTYVSLLGLDNAKQALAATQQEALDSLNHIPCSYTGRHDRLRRQPS